MAGKNLWSIESLKKELSQNPDIKHWVVSQEHIHRRERYFMLGDSPTTVTLDQDREVHTESITVSLAVKQSDPTRQGEISKKFFMNLPLDKQIRSAIESAQQTNAQAWDLPQSLSKEEFKSIPEIQTTDKRMAEDLDGALNKLSQQMIDLALQKRETQFNSAELFLSVHDFELHLSNGLTHRSSQSRIYAEAAFSYEQKLSPKKILSDEFVTRLWNVNLDQVSLEELFNETSSHARQTLDVIKPQSGKYAVMIDSEVLCALFNDFVGQLYAANAYHGLPFISVGKELIPGASGDLIHLKLDPSIPYGANSMTISSQGLVQKPLELVRDNIVVATASDKRYSDYMGTPATTSIGNIVLRPGKLGYKELSQSEPMVLEILQFSALFADRNTGTFSSEIRLARLYDNEKGTVHYVKGGSLSGSFFENFKKVKFSKQTTVRSEFSPFGTNAGNGLGNGYFGPTHALLNEVSIVS